MAIHVPGVGDIVRVTDVNQYGDLPSASAQAASAAVQTLTSATFANLPTTSVACSLQLTHALTKVAITFSAQPGNTGPGTPTNSGYISCALSGALAQASSITNSVFGVGNARSSGGSFTMYADVPAGTLTATLQGQFNTATGMTFSLFNLQMVAIRPL